MSRIIDNSTKGNRSMKHVTQNGQKTESSSTMAMLMSDWWFWAVIILLLGIILRWINLDQRPFHHDESLHAIYGMYTYMNPVGQSYKYDPMLHGPFMYNHVLPYIYNLFGSSTWAVRVMPAFLGSLLIFFPLFFKKYLSPTMKLFFMALLSFSPSMIYWSRFLREDLLIVMATVAILLARLLIKNLRWKMSIIAVLFALCFTIKENAFLHVALMLGFVLFELIICFSDYKNSSLFKFILIIRDNLQWSLISFALAAFVFSYIFSTGLTHMAGIIDGLYAKSLTFWTTQHSIDRIVGPFIFQVLMIGFYEAPLTILTIITGLHFYYKTDGKYRWAILGSLFVAIILHLWLKENLNFSPFFKDVLKLKIPIDIYPFILIAVHAVLGTFYYLKTKQKLLAISFYAFWSTLFTYSFVGEKVPWLAMYPLILGLMFNILYLEKNNIIQFTGKNWILSWALLFFINGYTLIIVNYSRAGADTELISQVHTNEVFQNTMYKIRDEMNYPTNGHPPTLFAEELWPTSWYFYNNPQYSFSLGDKKISDYDYVLVAQDKYKNELMATHESSIISLRHWWVPDYEKLSPLNIAIYLLSRRPWNDPGDAKVSLY